MLIVLSAVYYGGYRYRDLLAIEEKRELEVKMQKVIDDKNKENYEMSASLEVALAELKKKAKVITKVVEKEIEKPIYRDCVMPPTGVQLLNETARSLNASRKSKNTP
jgi:N-methylhydantoinase A/oxoprolinase/acetone carboxylase beta subunit